MSFSNLSRKPKPSSEDKPVKGRELQTLTISELNAIAGGALTVNHNETIQKPKPSSEKKPTEVRSLQTLTISELDAIAGGALSANHNETMI